MSGPTNGGVTRALEALRESEQLHRLVLQNISDAVFVTDDAGRFTFICPNVDVIFGYVPDEVHAMGSITGLLGPQLADSPLLVAGGEMRNLECDVRVKSGERRALLVHIKRVSIQGGTTLFACRDITERRNAEEAARVARNQLAHAARLQVAGQLMGSIAHEVTQPLAAISATAQTALRLIDVSPPDAFPRTALREMVHEVQNHGKSASEIIGRLRTLLRKQSLQLTTIDVNEAVRDLQRLVDGEARARGITIAVDLEPSSLRATADPICLRQAILNLVLNAMDAVGEVAGDRVIMLCTRRGIGGVEVSVTDTGPGLSDAVVRRLFEPFFTTKPQGMGLGLTIARSLAEAQGGDISFARPEKGARFNLTLPLAQ